MQSHEHVLRKLIEKGGRFFPTKQLKNNFPDLVEYTREINLSLATYKDNINALHQANATLADYRVNQIMKVLTIIAVLTFPLTLIATIFGIGAQDTPIVHTINAFWKISALLGSGALFMLILFKWRKWI